MLKEIPKDQGGRSKEGLNTIRVVFITSLEVVSDLVFIKLDPYTP